MRTAEQKAINHANSVRTETDRWKKEPLEKRVCEICLASEVEGDMHFLLDCGVYGAAWNVCKILSSLSFRSEMR